MEDFNNSNAVQQDTWQSLRSFTQARIALGRAGNSIPLDAILQIKLAYAHAKDAVYSLLDTGQLTFDLKRWFNKITVVQSNVKNRSEYLRRPDKGRQLNPGSIEKLNTLTGCQPGISIVIADGLSAKAINKHVVPVLTHLMPLLQKEGMEIMPICIAIQARVALGDHIGALLNAGLTLMFIGERPGLSSPESMSAYITYAPFIGRTDESRNCISNIRPEGLSYTLAAEKIFYIIREAMRLKISGTALKDETNLLTGNEI